MLRTVNTQCMTAIETNSKADLWAVDVNLKWRNGKFRPLLDALKQLQSIHIRGHVRSVWATLDHFWAYGFFEVINLSQVPICKKMTSWLKHPRQIVKQRASKAAKLRPLHSLTLLTPPWLGKRYQPARTSHRPAIPKGKKELNDILNILLLCQLNCQKA